MSENPPPPLASSRSELKNLKHHSQATVADLKTFLAAMKGRSPQEMLGVVAGNRLFRAMMQSVVLIAIVVAVFTVVPYLGRESDAEPAPAVEEPEKSSPVESPDGPATAEPAEPAALEALGVGTEKAAPPEVNPLDADTGNFLEELE